MITPQERPQTLGLPRLRISQREDFRLPSWQDWAASPLLSRASHASPTAQCEGGERRRFLECDLVVVSISSPSMEALFASLLCLLVCFVDWISHLHLLYAHTRRFHTVRCFFGMDIYLLQCRCCLSVCFAASRGSTWLAGYGILVCLGVHCTLYLCL